MKTLSAKLNTNGEIVVGDRVVPRRWVIVDVAGKPLGRAATVIAHHLRGKHQPFYTPHVDTGDVVVVINADKVTLSGQKWTQKFYYHHTGFPGGIRSIRADKLAETKPTDLVKKAVNGMLPSGPLGRRIFRKLKVYTGTKHPHAAQQPQPLEI